MTASVDSRSFPSSKERKATIDRGIERNRWSKTRRKGKEGKRRSASIDRSFGFRKEGVASNHHFDRPPPKTRKPLPSSLSLSLLFSSLQHFSFLSSTILVRFLLSRRGKRRGRKSSHWLFFVATRILLEARRIPRRGCSASRQREREEARACVSPIKARRRERTRNRYGRETRNKR